MIEPARSVTEYVVFCPSGHRCVVSVLDEQFERAPAEPPGGWPGRCPECTAEIDYDGPKIAKTKIGGKVWVRSGGGEERRYQHEFGAGAMFEAFWVPDSWRGPDGRSIGVVLPPGRQSDIWLIDGPAASGGSWERRGVPPKLTVTPSILTGSYHGFLTEGVLTDSLPDRPMKENGNGVA